MKYLVCISRENFGDFSTDDLTLGRLYKPLEPVDEQGMVRIIDDSGEDYLYPSQLFEEVEVSRKTGLRLQALSAA